MLGFNGTLILWESIDLYHSLYSTRVDEVEAVSLKIRAPTLNFWTIFEVPVRNFDSTVTLLSIMQLQFERMCMFTSNHQLTWAFLKVKCFTSLPLVVNDCIFRIWSRVLGGCHEALVDVHPLRSRTVWSFGLKVHRLAQGVSFGSCDFITRCCGKVRDVSHRTILHTNCSCVCLPFKWSLKTWWNVWRCSEHATLYTCTF